MKLDIPTKASIHKQITEEVKEQLKGIYKLLDKLETKINKLEFGRK